MSTKGWVKLHRVITEGAIFDNEKLLKVWIWCLCKATHKNRNQMIGKQFVDLKPGQFATGRNKAGAELNMPPSTAWDYLKLLEKNASISIKSNNRFSVVTVENWGVYQSDGNNSDSTLTADGQQNNSTLTADGQHLDTNKNVKNIKNDKKVVVEGVPSPETTNPDKVPSHCQDDPVLIFLNQVSSYYTTLTGRFTSPNDEVAITDISNLTVDFELVRETMNQSNQNFKPKYSGDKIRSFSYFVPAIKTRIAAEKTRRKAPVKPERKIADGEHSQGNIDRKTVELIKNSKKDWGTTELPEVNF